MNDKTLIYGITSSFSGANIEFEVDGPELSIEVIIPAPSGDESASFYLTDDQVLVLKELIDKVVKNIKDE